MNQKNDSSLYSGNIPLRYVPGKPNEKLLAELSRRATKRNIKHPVEILELLDPAEQWAINSRYWSEIADDETAIGLALDGALLTPEIIEQLEDEYVPLEKLKRLIVELVRECKSAAARKNGERAHEPGKKWKEEAKKIAREQKALDPDITKSAAAEYILETFRQYPDLSGLPIKNIDDDFAAIRTIGEWIKLAGEWKPGRRKKKNSKSVQ